MVPLSCTGGMTDVRSHYHFIATTLPFSLNKKRSMYPCYENLPDILMVLLYPFVVVFLIVFYFWAHQQTQCLDYQTGSFLHL